MASDGQRRILLCLDGSDTAACAFQWYLDNVQKDCDYVYGCVVVEYDVSGFTAGGADAVQISKKFAEQFKKNEQLTADYTAKLRQSHAKGQVDTYTGKTNKPGQTIVETADMLNVDMIIMGTRGLGAIKRAIMGSVSQYVVQNCGRPISIVPKNEC